jgi:hypothetical protein
MPRNPSLEDLWAEMEKGDIYECSLHDPNVKWQIDGLQDGKRIYIDPRPAVLETLIHELLHRLKPTWSERTVEIAARNMAVRMDKRTKARWFLAYNRIKRKGRPVELDHE